MDKTHYGSVIAPFSVQFVQPFSYAGGVPSNQPLFIVINWFILAIQQTITH